MNHPHSPVLLEDILRVFKDLPLNTFVDGTLGAGGHAEALLHAHPEIRQYLGIDQDPEAREIAMKRLAPWKEKIVLCPGNFSELEKFLDREGIEQVDGILMDLGVSSMQLDRPEKGFSFMREGPLDMRMDPEGKLTAADIVNTWSERELGRVFRDYGEEKQWRAAARVVARARESGPITTTLQLAQVLRPVLERGKKKKGIHPLTLVFQGLRICVNGELEALEAVVPKAIKRLRKGGRLAIISFHSLEDRIVKNAFRYAASDKENTSGIGGVFLTKIPQVLQVTRKPLIPNIKEMDENPRSRSAKLRVVEKINEAAGL